MNPETPGTEPGPSAWLRLATIGALTTGVIMALSGTWLLAMNIFGFASLGNALTIASFVALIMLFVPAKVCLILVAVLAIHERRRPPYLRWLAYVWGYCLFFKLPIAVLVYIFDQG